MRILTAACCLSAILALVTNRWVAGMGSSPAFGIVNFRALWFQCQWVGFVISLAVVGGCLLAWHSSARLPWLTAAGGGLAVFYVAGGVLTTRADQWASGASAPSGWWQARQHEVADRGLRARFAGEWRSPEGVWTIGAESVQLPGCEAGHVSGVSMGQAAELVTPELRRRFAGELDDVRGELPVLDVSCADRLYMLALVSERALLAVPWPKGELQLLRRAAR